MAWLKRDEIKSIVGKSLKEVADFNGDFEVFDFSKFHDYHKQVFINTIAAELAKKGFSVTLSREKLKTFNNIKALIDYIVANQVYDGPPEVKILLS